MSLPLLHAGRTNPGLSAQLDLRFALDKSLTAYRGPTPSFSRASTGSYFDGSGVLRYANVNTILYSEDFSNAYWSKLNASISANSAVSPDGKTTADKIVENSSLGVHCVYRIETITASTYTFSIYMKAGERSWANLNITTGANIYTYFDLANGTIGSVGSGHSASITPEGNGWYRCAVTFTGTAVPWYLIAGASTGDNVASYTGDGSSGIYIWGAQLEASSTVGTYCPTTSSANSAPRFNHTYNGTSWVSRGLLVEEQRTNILQFSNSLTNSYWGKSNCTVTANSVTSPDGTQNAALVTFSDSSAGSIDRHINSGTAWNVSGLAYTQSYFVKAGTQRWIQFKWLTRYSGSPYKFANFDTLNMAFGTASSGITTSVADIGNGWYRISATATANSTGAGEYLYVKAIDNDSAVNATLSTNGGTIYLYGMQWEEAASFPTSYIPTTSASVTRSADVCQITGSDFSGLWNGTEGSFATEYDGQRGNAYIFATHNGGGGWQNSINLRRTNSDDLNQIFTSGVGQAGNSITGPANGVSVKNAFAFKLDDYASSFNGLSVVTDNSCTLPTVSRMDIGYSSAEVAPFNGHIARLRYFNKRLPNATLQLLSEPDPTLNLQFALNKSLTPVAGPAPSFSRASTGTFFNASGVLTSASINTPRFDHVYSGGQWVSRGLLLEEQRTNLCLWSGDMTQASWTKQSAVTVTGNASSWVDGTNASQRINYPANSSYKSIYRSFTGTAAAYTASVYAKAGTVNWLGLGCVGGNPQTDGAFFNLSNGTIGTTAAGVTAAIQNCGDGWYRCAVMKTHTAATSYIQIEAHTEDNQVPNYTSNGTETIFVAGAQVELGSFPTSYIGTTTSSVIRSADVCQITGTSFGWMWNQGEGSVFTEFDTNAPSVPLATSGFNTQIFAARNSSNNQRIYLGTENFGGRRFYIDDGAGSSSVISPGALIGNGVINKASVAWKTNDMAASFDGASVLTDNSQIIPTGITQIDFGKSPANTNYLCGHIAKLIYYPARLTNTKLQQLST